MSDPYTTIERKVLDYLENRSAQVDPSGTKPPTLFDGAEILQHCGEGTYAALWDLEVKRILTHDTHDGRTYYGFHPAIVGMPGDHGTTYTIDPDLVCDRCGQPSTSSCLMGVCS